MYIRKDTIRLGGKDVWRIGGKEDGKRGDVGVFKEVGGEIDLK
jgi:hypothetical protein